MINEMYLQASRDVIGTPGFLNVLALLCSVGLIIGAFYNNGFKGFRQSLILLVPVIFALLYTTSMRLEYIKSTGLTFSSTAYNAPISFIFLSIVYLAGLALGHTIVSRTVRSIYKQHGIKPQNGLLIKP